MDIAFVGTDLHGWQYQPGLPTVQGLLDNTLAHLGHNGPRIVGCSRTDAGVHAASFTAHLDTGLERPSETILEGLNAKLPPSIRVLSVSRVLPEFHARFSATGKTYGYHVCRGRILSPFLEPFAWRWSGKLDYEAMKESAAIIEGEHDFASFTTACGRERNTLLTVDECFLEENRGMLVFTVSGRSFLHKMVRRVVGALMAVGRGRLNPEETAVLLEGYREEPNLVCVPAKGLMLRKVSYPPPFDQSPAHPVQHFPIQP